MSLSAKTEKWLSANCGRSMRGKTVAITGANSGVGFKMAETMVYLGAKVIMACRDLKKASAAKADLLRDHPGADIDILRLDLADFASIDSFVKALADEGRDIDVFVNNAGVFHHPGEKTADGLELVIGTNYVGVFRLTEELLPYLAGLPHEVVYVNTGSMIHKIAPEIDYGDFYYAKHYRNLPVYARSKLCVARYTYALAKKYEGTNVCVLMSHPGIALTPLGLNAFGPWVTKLSHVLGRAFNSPEKSSLSLAYITARELPAGSIVGPTKLLGGWGYPKQNRVLRKVKRGSEQLIAFTEKEIASKA